MKVACLIVLYNKLIKDSQAYETLKNTYLDLFFIDNSDQEIYVKNNQEFANNYNLHYYSMHGNIGLSKAYNFFVKEAKCLGYDYILISDDDTLYTQEFLDELQDNLSKDYDVILPIIRDNILGHLVSPAVRQRKISKAIIGKPEGDFNVIGAFNSGMCVNLRCYDNWQYNENVFLYFVDIDFCDNNLVKNKLKTHVLDCEIRQNCSSSEPFSDQSLKRLYMVLDDAKKFYPSKFKYFTYKLFLVKRMWEDHKNKKVFKLLKY